MLENVRFDNAHSAIRVVVDPFVHRETVNDGRTGPRRRRNDSAKKRKSVRPVNEPACDPLKI